MKKLIILSLAILTVSCANRTPSPYEKYSFWALDIFGYKDEKLPDGTYNVYYMANKATDMKTVRGYFERRASELCPTGYSIQQIREEYDAHTTTTQYASITEHFPTVEGIIKCSY